eukprot:TRINITY_DN20607_c0_g1_i2.p1 TRINITY_DN20607_c0_g1~~TRINITY_DN20607_c0_g1_i2.p1  ORF type:complete len:165 (+),score=10.59 TRINITY_DN20607_c0_g1_i2:132-626(+)
MECVSFGEAATAELAPMSMGLKASTQLGGVGLFSDQLGGVWNQYRSSPSSSKEYFSELSDRELEVVLMTCTSSSLVYASGVSRRFCRLAEEAVRESFPGFFVTMFENRPWRQVLFWHCGPQDPVAATDRIQGFISRQSEQPTLNDDTVKGPQRGAPRRRREEVE